MPLISHTGVLQQKLYSEKNGPFFRPTLHTAVSCNFLIITSSPKKQEKPRAVKSADNVSQKMLTMTAEKILNLHMMT